MSQMLSCLGTATDLLDIPNDMYQPIMLYPGLYGVINFPIT